VNFGICDLSVIPLRAEPSDKSEMVSQLLFGEVFEVLENSNNKWLRVHTISDDYTGWVDEKQVQLIAHAAFKEMSTAPAVSLPGEIGLAESKFRDIQLLPGSSLPLPDGNFFTMNDERFKFIGISSAAGENTIEQVPEFALHFLDAPYLWGGRSIFGIDCSGLTNVVFKMAGIHLRRDAWQQSEQGILVSFIDEARPGDLAFFNNEEGKIVHTGIILDHKKIIHASGRVRMDTVDHYGIFNEEQKRYTHQLRLIKRMIG
jgi:hypothetical protein